MLKVTVKETGNFRKKLDDLARGGVHYVNIIVAFGTAPTEGQYLAIGSPRRVDQIAFVGQIHLGGVGAVHVHHVELGDAAAVANVDDRLAGLGIPGG